MALTDENVATLAMMLFTFGFTFALGAKKHPGFFILCGIIGLVFAIELWNLLQSQILSIVLIGISLLLMVFGLFIRPEIDSIAGE